MDSLSDTHTLTNIFLIIATLTIGAIIGSVAYDLISLLLFILKMFYDFFAWLFSLFKRK